MKRLLYPVLLALLLTACASPSPLPPETLGPTEAATEAATEPAGLYDPARDLETATGGALRVYPLGLEDATGIAPMGDDVILFSGSDATTLTKLTGQDLYIAAETRLECAISPADPHVQVSEKGITFYDGKTHALVFLDTTLKEVSRVALPADIQGAPALSTDRRSLFYCTDSTLMVLDLETSLHKLLKEMTFPTQSVGGLHCDDTVVECDIIRNDGAELTYFFSAETGGMLWEADEPLTLTTHGDRYFAIRADGTFQELVTGTVDGEPLALDFGADAKPLAFTGGSRILLVTADTEIHLFDPESGKRTASVDLKCAPVDACQAGDGSPLWLLGQDILCRWDASMSPTGDETGYVIPRITPENPDTEGLLRCRQMAEDISRAHQVDIRIWTDALELESQDYALTAEYRVSVLEDSLTALDRALDQYPEGFLKLAAQGTGTPRINLVRSVTGISDSVPEDPTALQLWSRSEEFRIWLEVGTDLEQELHRSLFRLIESRVFSTCSAYDRWNDLNPEGFAYDYDHWLNSIREDQHLTEGDERAFIDIRSMSFPTEDRARIMACAIAEGNEDLFAAPILQEKLRILCAGIRQAFDLQKYEAPLPWEQYLA